MGCGASTNQQPVTSQPQKPGNTTEAPPTVKPNQAPEQKSPAPQNITSNKTMGNSQSNSKLAGDANKTGKALNPEESAANKSKTAANQLTKSQKLTSSSTKIATNNTSEANLKKSGSQKADLKNTVSPSKVNLRVSEHPEDGTSEKMATSGIKEGTSSGIRQADNANKQQHQEAEQIIEDEEDGLDADKKNKKKKKKTGSVDPKLNSLIKIYGF